MARPDQVLMLTGVAGGLALVTMLMAKAISPARFAQGLAGGLMGLGVAKLVLVLAGGGHD